jgi:hypothetical protein
VEEFKVQSPKSKVFYRLTILLFALALMAKPMAVTLPFVLLLLDAWPLARVRGRDWPTWRRLVLEKGPLLLLSAVWCGITIWAQGIGQAVATRADLSVSERIVHTMISFVHYLCVMVFPWHLAAYYPYQHHEAAIWGAGAGAALLLVTWLVVAAAPRRPYLAVGWLWFMGMLVPVIGLVQVGGQAWADRYLYLPSIGFIIMVIWAGAEWAARFPIVKLLVPLSGAALAGMTLAELPYWKDTSTLYGRAMEVTANNYLAMTLVGVVDEDNGKPDAAIRLYRQAIACKPSYPEAHFFLGRALETKGRTAAAAGFRRRADYGRPVAGRAKEIR